MSMMKGKQMSDLPHPIGATVVDRVTGRLLLIASLRHDNCGAETATYSTIGHPVLGTEATAGGWKAHSDLELLGEPTNLSWRLLKDATWLDQQTRVIRRC